MKNYNLEVTKDELYLIERVFDICHSQLTKNAVDASEKMMLFRATKFNASGTADEINKQGKNELEIGFDLFCAVRQMFESASKHKAISDKCEKLRMADEKDTEHN